MGNKKTLVLGASIHSFRYSFMAIHSLVEKGHTVIAIGRDQGDVAGVKIQNKKNPLEEIDTVTMYLNPRNQRDYYNYIIEVKPKRVIFNPVS